MIQSNDQSGPGARTATRQGLDALAIGVASGLLGVALLLAGARWSMPSPLAGPIAEGGWTDRSRAWFVSGGFFDAELDVAHNRQFSWTGGAARLAMPELDRSQAYRLTFVVSAGRPVGAPPPPLLVLAVDGVDLVTAQTSDAPTRVSVDLPRGPATGALVTLALSNTFRPSAGDNRALGVVIDDVSLAPATGHFRPSAYVLTRAGLAIALFVAGVLWCGVRGRWAAGSAAAIVVGLTWLLLQDGAFIGTYVDGLVHIGAGIALAGVLVGLLRARWPIMAGLPDWSVAVGLVLGASAVKLAVFTHPLAMIGDAIFQVHRAQLVHRGTYFFTSVTPKPFFEFPYAIALYVTAQPFWQHFPSNLDLVRLLRGLTVGADALTGLAIYAAARRQWQNRLTALLCAVLWTFARAPFEALNNANLTNVFGQGFFGAALGVIAWTAAGTSLSVPALVLSAVLLTVAFLSHFSTLSVGLPLACAVGVLLIAAGRAPVRRLGLWVLVLTVGAAALSYGVYYSHFNAIYAETFARVTSHAAPLGNSKLVAPAATKASRMLGGATDDYGLPGIPLFIAAVAGAWLLVGRKGREGLTLILAAWAFVWIGFEALGVFTAIEMRANLAAAPMFVCFGAYALGTLASRSRLGAALAAVGALAIGLDGLRLWMMCLGR
jgi:hypothetical protein